MKIGRFLNFSGHAPFVAVMEAADFGYGDDVAESGGCVGRDSHASLSKERCQGVWIPVLMAGGTARTR